MKAKPTYQELEEQIASLKKQANINQRIDPAGSAIIGHTQAEEAAAQTKFFLEEMSKIAKIGYWEIVPNADFVVWSDEVYCIHEVPVGEKVTLDQALKFFLPEDQSRLGTAVELAFSEGIPYNIELRLTTAKGKELVTNAICLPVKRDGKVEKLMGTFQDITDRRLMEEALSKTQRTLLSAMQSMTDAVFISDSFGAFIDFNEAFATFHRIADKNECYRALNEWPNFIEVYNLDGSVLPLEQWVVSRALNGEKGTDEEYVVERKDTGERWYGSYSFSPILDRKGTIIGSVTVAKDITNRKKVEQQLLASKSKYKDLFLNMMNAFALHEMIFDENGEAVDFRFLEVNPYWEKVVGMTAEMVIDKTVRELFPDIEDSWIQIYGNVVKTGNPEEFVDYNKATGKHFHTYAYRSGTGEFAVLFNDVSKEKEFEADLIVAKEQAEESDRLKSAFLANMSHEIRTPMNGIIGFTSLLKQPGYKPEERQEFLDIIVKSGHRMLSTVNDIIDVSKIEAGQVKVRITEINLNEELNSIVAFFLPEAKENKTDIQISNRVPEKLARIKTDEEKLNSILTNLIKNAIKYTSCGKIEIEYFIRNTAGISELEIHVKDTGIGIPKKRLDAIFKRFEQADIENQMAYEGSGLGLAIAKAYVTMLGGKIWVTSEEGKGSEFSFTITLDTSSQESTENSTEIPEVKKSAKSGFKVLIADDDEYAEKYLYIALKNHTREILVAKTGIEAVELCRSNRDIDVVFMDIRIPGVNGLEATRQIRSFNREVYIVAQTAYAISGDREKCIQAGCDEYIPKPIDFDNLFVLLGKRL